MNSSNFHAAFCLLFLAVSLSLPQTKILRGPYLQLSTSSSIVIVWRTNRPIEPVVAYGKTLNSIDQKESDNYVLRISPVVENGIPDRHFSRLHSAPPNTYQYEMTLSGLEPETKYFYEISDGETILEKRAKAVHFSTHPPEGEQRSVRIWVVGDSGTGEEDQLKVYQAALDQIASNGKPLTMYLHVGDMAYTDGKEDEFQQNYFDVYQPTLQNTVCWPAMGNHEGHTSSGKTQDGPYYDAYVLPTNAAAGGVASGTEAYYSFDYGAVHFICLDSHDLDRHERGDMARWLQMDLKANDSEWLIAFWHHPPYTKGSHDSDNPATDLQLVEMRERIMPILEDHGVDLVLTGHSHVYEPSMLIDKAYQTPTVAGGVILDDGDGNIQGDGAYRKSVGLNPHEGVAQIVTGHGGAAVTKQGISPIMRQTLVEHGSVFVDIDGDLMTVQMIGKTGEVRDEFHMAKEGKVVQEIVEEPWSPIGPAILPGSGPITGSDFKVTLHQNGFWSRGQIRYTIDGSEPTETSTLYVGPVGIQSDEDAVVIKARSFMKETQPTFSNMAILKNYGPDIPKIQNQIKIDGNLEDWDDRSEETIPLDERFLYSSEFWTGPSDLSGQLKLGWTNEGLYVAISITDDEYLPDRDAAKDRAYNNDSIVIMFDGRELGEQYTTDKLGAGAYMVCVRQGSDEDNYNTFSLADAKDWDDYEFSFQRTLFGYNAEFFIPFSEKHFPVQKFQSGRSIQLAVTVFDFDTDKDSGSSTRTRMIWGGKTSPKAHKFPSYWKPLKLGH